MANQATPSDYIQDVSSFEQSDIPIREPVPVAVLLGQPELGIQKFPFLKGRVSLELERSMAVMNVFNRSAYFLYPTLPKAFIPLAAQVFYKEQKVEEVRIAINYPSPSSQAGKTEWVRWATPVPPKFKIREDRTLLLAPEDVGRTYIMAYRQGTSFLFAWDITNNACH